MREEIVFKTQDLIEEILDSVWFKAYVEAHKVLHQATDLAPRLEAFQKAQARYLTSRQYGSHHPDLKEAKLAYAQLKAAIFSEERVKTYLTAHREVEAQLATLSNTLAQAISAHIKTTPVIRQLWEAQT